MQSGRKWNQGKVKVLLVLSFSLPAVEWLTLVKESLLFVLISPTPPPPPPPSFPFPWPSFGAALTGSDCSLPRLKASPRWSLTPEPGQGVSKVCSAHRLSPFFSSFLLRFSFYFLFFFLFFFVSEAAS